MDVRDAWERYRVLHVNSNPDFLNRFSSTFKTNFDITSVREYTEALHLLSSTPFDILIVDTRQPGECLHHLQQLEKSNPGSPAILYTGEKNAHEAFVSGDIEYFAREFICEENRDNFISAVHRAVTKKRGTEDSSHSSEQKHLTGYGSANYKMLGFTTEEVLNPRFDSFVSEQFHSSLQKQHTNETNRGERVMRNGMLFMDTAASIFTEMGEYRVHPRGKEDVQSYRMVRRRKKGRDPGMHNLKHAIDQEDNLSWNTMSEGLFRAIHDVMPTPIVVVNDQGIIMAANKAWFSFVIANGYPGDNFSAGRRYFDFWEATRSEGDYLEEVIWGLQEVIEGRMERYTGECRQMVRDENRWYLVKFQRFLYQGKHMVTIAHENITDRKRWEEDLLRQNKELDDFAFRISHDLKNPLSLVIGYLAAINEEPALFESYYNRVIALSDKMETFINNLLQLCRAGRVLNERTSIDLNMLIRSIFAFNRPSDVEASLIITSPLPVINGDAQAIELVMSNLLDNAFKYRDKEKEVLVLEIDCEQKNREANITLRDNGSGIPGDMLDKIFDAGFTLSQSEGTGFGLPIARKIIEAHGGSINAESDGPGTGATFRITLPL